MSDEEEVVKELFQRAGRLAMVLALMQKMNIEADAHLKTADKLFVVAGPEHGDIPGSLRALCDTCGATVWLGPDSQKKIVDRGSLPSQIMCIACFIAKTKEDIEKNA